MVKATDSTIKALVDDALREHGIGVDLNFIDTSEVTDMSELFRNTKFIGDISKWNTSKVTDINYMFYSSVFNGDLSDLDMSNVRRADKAFMHSRFTGDLSKWKFNIENPESIFKGSKFCGHCNGKWYKNGNELTESEFIEFQIEKLEL